MKLDLNRRILTGVVTAALVTTMAVPAYSSELTNEEIVNSVRTTYKQTIKDIEFNPLVGFTQPIAKTHDEVVSAIKEQYSTYDVNWFASGAVFKDGDVTYDDGVFYKWELYEGTLSIYGDDGTIIKSFTNLKGHQGFNNSGYGIINDSSYEPALIDSKGNVLIPFGKYEVIQSFEGKYAYVYKNSKMGVVDVSTGKVVVPLKYSFSMAMARYEKYGSDLNRYFEKEKLMPVKRNGLFGYVNSQGVEVIPCIYDEADIFSEGLAYVKKNGQGRIINSDNKTVANLPKGYRGTFFSEGFMEICNNNVFPELYGYCDTSGKIVIKPQYHYAGYFENGVAIVTHLNRVGVIDKKNTVIIPFDKYDDIKRSGDKERLFGFIQRIHPKLGIVTTTASYYAASILGTDGKVYVDNCVLITPGSTFMDGVIPFRTMVGYESEWGKSDIGYLDRDGKVVHSFSDIQKSYIPRSISYYPLIIVQADTPSIYGEMYGIIQIKSGAQNQSSQNAKYSKSRILVDGKQIELEVYNINRNNYFKLRDIAQIVSGTSKQFDVFWNKSKNAIEMTSGNAYTPVGGELSRVDGKDKAAVSSKSNIFKDGQRIDLTAYAINSNNYFKLRDICRAFNIGVSWDGNTNTMEIDINKDYTEE